MKAKNKKNLISFQIYRIETLQYAVLKEEIKAERLSLESGFGFGIDAEAGFIRTIFDYTFSADDMPALKLEVAVEFKIEENCFKTEIDKKKQWIIPNEFAIHMAMVAVGTARGILHEKTRGSELNNFPLPAIDVMGAIKGDVVIEKSN